MRYQFFALLLRKRFASFSSRWCNGVAILPPSGCASGVRWACLRLNCLERKQNSILRSVVMLQHYPYYQQRRNKKRFDWREIIGPVICGVAVTYVLTAGVLGLLAR